LDSDDADFANDVVVSRRCLGRHVATSAVSGASAMEYGMPRRARPEQRFDVIFIAAEVAITVVIGSAFFASIAKILL
jgi:hypothetical protein